MSDEENKLKITNDMDNGSASLEFTSDGHVGIHLPKDMTGNDEEHVRENVVLATGITILLEHTNLTELAGHVVDNAEDFDHPKSMKLPELKWTFKN